MKTVLACGLFVASGFLPTHAADESPTAGPADVVTRAAIAYRPNPNDYYPNTSLSLGEEGVVSIWFCYDERGKVTEAEVAKSSGFQRLDTAALIMSKQFRIKPKTVNRAPMGDCGTMPIEFKLPPKKPKGIPEELNRPMDIDLH